MPLPRLLKLESCLADYTVKATISGITILKQNRFRKRYTGSKAHAVDINGKLWVNANELKKLINPAPVKAKKKGPGIAVPEPITTEIENKFTEYYDELPTHEINFLTNLPQLSTEPPPPAPIKKGYKVHKREVRQRLLGMIHSKAGKKELYFWTISFPKGTPDDIGYQAFNTWLTTLRTRDAFGRRFLKNYLWVAERQQNGTIHFHIAIPHKLPVRYANGAMQTILKSLCKKGLVPFTVAQCKRYNGVDIAKNRNTKRVTNFAIKKGARALITYLTKYITKNDETFTHLAWHNSRGFSSLFTGVTFTRDEFNKLGVPAVGDYGLKYLRKWTHCLEPLEWREGVDEVLNAEGKIELKKQYRFRYKVETEFFYYQPWNSFGCPENILNHLAELNSHLQDLATHN